MRTLFQFEHVFYQYKKDDFALTDLSFTIRPHVKTAIVGGNGSGKSTTVFHMDGLFPCQKGQLFYKGKEVDRKVAKTMVDHVGLVFQDPDDQIVALEVIEDVMFGPLQREKSYEEAKELAKEALDQLHISHLAERDPHSLSYGQKKLVSIAGVLAMQTETIILDEPMAFLDPFGKKEVQSVMNTLHEQGKHVIVTTHDMQLVAEWADEVIIMKHGRCLGQMTPKDLFCKPSLLQEAKLELPPIAKLMQLVDVKEDSLPITVFEAAEWIKHKLVR